MKQFTINIGLHNNPLAIKRADDKYSMVQDKIQDLLNLAFEHSSDFYRIEIGKWDGADEPTFVGYVEADEYTIDKKVQLLCDIMEQVCIPYDSAFQSNLVYQSFWQGQKLDFSNEYFIS